MGCCVIYVNSICVNQRGLDTYSTNVRMTFTITDIRLDRRCFKCTTFRITSFRALATRERETEEDRIRHSKNNSLPDNRLEARLHFCIAGSGTNETIVLDGNAQYSHDADTRMVLINELSSVTFKFHTRTDLGMWCDEATLHYTFLFLKLNLFTLYGEWITSIRSLIPVRVASK